jgi:hypothetical protein
VPPVRTAADNRRMSDDAGWNCTVLSAVGGIELEQGDDAGEEWLAIGPAGEAIGALDAVLSSAAGEGVDLDWVQAVAAAIGREIAVGERRRMLLVKRGAGVWYHATFASNRESIQRNGLDWRLMHGGGIAGSRAPEWPGVFLCATPEDASFFVRIGSRRGPVDVWSVELDGEWLEGARDSDMGGGDNWMICPVPIPSTRLKLLQRDLRMT